MTATQFTERAQDRRVTDRRVADVPFEGPDRRKAPRRTGDERRAQAAG